jgi:hypothetical protein
MAVAVLVFAATRSRCDRGSGWDHHNDGARRDRQDLLGAQL